MLDVGSFDVNGTYRDLIPDAWSYVVSTLAGPNVDVVVADPYNWAELNGRQFDLVISGQCLEHCEFPWLTANEMLCHLRVGGFAAVVAPFVQARHNHPHDYWRFLDSGLKALSAVALTRSNLVWLREQSRFRTLGFWAKIESVMRWQSFNKVILLGNLTRDPEVRFTPNGTAVCDIGLAVNRKWKNQAGELQEEVTLVVDVLGSHGYGRRRLPDQGQTGDAGGRCIWSSGTTGRPARNGRS